MTETPIADATKPVNGGDAELVITRVLAAPRDLVWKAWTEADRLARWWGPKGYAFETSKLEVRPEGTFLYAMRPPGGKTMWGKFVFEAVEAPSKLVFQSSFSDAEGATTRAPFHAAWPLRVWNELLLDEHDGQTTLTLRVRPEGANDEERAVFASSLGPIEQGFAGTFDQLVEYLRSIS